MPARTKVEFYRVGLLLAPWLAAGAAVFLAPLSAAAANSQIIEEHVVDCRIVSGRVRNPNGINLVFLGDGFTEGDSLDFYRQEVDKIVNELKTSYPLGHLAEAFTIYRVDVASDQVGVDVLTGCAERVAIDVENALKTHFCGEIDLDGDSQEESFYMFIESSDPDLVSEYADYPFGSQPNLCSTQTNSGYADEIIVLVNDREFGGAGIWHSPSGGGIAYISVASAGGGAPDTNLYNPVQEAEEHRGTIRATAIHELGHSIFGLGDEYCNYNAYPNCLPDSSQQSFLEPFYPNITAQTTRTGLAVSKPAWEGLCPGSGRIPVRSNPACGGSTPQTSGHVALFQGGGRISCGLYRPSKDCKMNWDARVDFCPVCRDRVLKKLEPHLRSNIHVFVDEIRVGSLPIDQGKVRELTYGVAINGTAATGCFQPGTRSPASLHRQLPAAKGHTLDTRPPTIPLRQMKKRIGIIRIPSSGLPDLVTMSIEVLGEDDKVALTCRFDVPARAGVHLIEHGDLRLTASVAVGSH